jgi:hypothetical protein
MTTVMDGMVVGDRLERIPLDHYPTPFEYAMTAVQKMKGYTRVDFPDVLDVGAGKGVWGRAVKQTWKAPYLMGVEIDDELPLRLLYDEWIHTDFLDKDFNPNKFDMIIGNPPYKDVEEIIRKSHSLLNDDGYLGFLLRLSFLESSKRGKGLWVDLPPEEVSVAMNRISFYGEGKTNTTAYAFYIWKKQPSGHTKLTWMDWKGKDK